MEQEVHNSMLLKYLGGKNQAIDQWFRWVNILRQAETDGFEI